jgi:hypothetical protein
MSLHACKECNREISSDAKVCPHCGKKQGTSTGVGCLAVLGILLLGGAISSWLRDNQSTTPQEVVQPKPPAPPLKPPAATETLGTAKKELASGQPDKVADLVKPLLTDPKYGKEARQLLNPSILQMKDQLAAPMQRSLFDSGEEVYVKATGPKKETIEFSGPLIGAVWVHQFMRSEMPGKLSSMGFKRASFVNDITFELWSQKLE